MKYLYTKDFNDQNTVTVIADDRALIVHTGIKPYQRRDHANAYLKALANGATKLPEPDEIVPIEEGESQEDFEDRLVGEHEHIGYFEQIFPANVADAFTDPIPFYKNESLFACFAPAAAVWYRTKKEAKDDADGVETIYLGEVDVYDPAVVKQIEDEIKSYPG